MKRLRSLLNRATLKAVGALAVLAGASLGCGAQPKYGIILDPTCQKDADCAEYPPDYRCNPETFECEPAPDAGAPDGSNR
jgi:hypothetical protein